MPAILLPEQSLFVLTPRVLVRRQAALEGDRDATCGRALRTLRHAVEYLQNSRLASIGTSAADPVSDNQAVHILLRLSRAVFREYDRPPEPPAGALRIPAQQAAA